MGILHLKFSVSYIFVCRHLTVLLDNPHERNLGKRIYCGRYKLVESIATRQVIVLSPHNLLSGNNYLVPVLGKIILI